MHVVKKTFIIIPVFDWPEEHWKKDIEKWFFCAKKGILWYDTSPYGTKISKWKLKKFCCLGFAAIKGG